MGHQIIRGLAEHMPFSTRQSLSFSQINSSNYTAPPTEKNSEAIVVSRMELGSAALLVERHKKLWLSFILSCYCRALFLEYAAYFMNLGPRVDSCNFGSYPHKVSLLYYMAACNYFKSLCIKACVK